jgi:hypothetical protein
MGRPRKQAPRSIEEREQQEQDLQQQYDDLTAREIEEYERSMDQEQRDEY